MLLNNLVFILTINTIFGQYQYDMPLDMRRRYKYQNSISNVGFHIQDLLDKEKNTFLKEKPKEKLTTKINTNVMNVIEPNEKKSTVTDLQLLSLKISSSLDGILQTSKNIQTRTGVSDIFKKTRRYAERNHQISLEMFERMKARELNRIDFIPRQQRDFNTTQTITKTKIKRKKVRSLKQKVKRKLRRLKENKKINGFMYMDMLHWIKSKKRF